MSYQPTYGQPTYPQQAPPTNGLGLAGFIVSLAGFVTCGILCPVGLILSLIGLFRRPRGFAVAGVIVGLIGTIIPVVMLAMYGFALFSCLNLGTTLKPYGDTAIATSNAQREIEGLHSRFGALPLDVDGETAISTFKDGWGHPLHYRRTGPGEYEIRSAGPDGILSNSDDQTTSFNAGTGPSPTTMRFPTTRPTLPTPTTIPQIER